MKLAIFIGAGLALLPVAALAFLISPGWAVAGGALAVGFASKQLI